MAGPESLADRRCLRTIREARYSAATVKNNGVEMADHRIVALMVAELQRIKIMVQLHKRQITLCVESRNTRFQTYAVHRAVGSEVGATETLILPQQLETRSSLATSVL